MGPAILLAKEVKALREKLKRLFSSYKSLSEVLTKYSIDSNGTDTPLSIEFSEDALVQDSVEYQTLRSGVKKVLGTVVWLLACANESPKNKRVKIESYRSKIIVY